MIGRLRGTVVSESPDGAAVIDVRGVGYEVLTPLGTLGRAHRDADGTVTLMIHTHVREDAIALFGFSDERERTAFRMLTAVAGVGPRIAVSILGTLPSADLAGTVARGDIKRLQSVPGVGRKIAERLALELKDKLAAGVALSAQANGSAPGPAVTVAPSREPPRPMRDLTEALVRLGFKPLEAERAAATLEHRAGESLEALVREALRSLTA
jgi:Holliday junction DNA helicase RuvA